MIKFKIQYDEDEILKAFDNKLNQIVEDVFNDSQQIIVQKKIIDEGTLLKSGNINRSFLQKEIIYSVPYADVIEFGRLPGTMPPSEPIKAWVKRKGIATKDPELSRITWAIMVHIKKDGLMPRPFLSPAIEMARERLRRK